MLGRRVYNSQLSWLTMRYFSLAVIFLLITLSAHAWTPSFIGYQDNSIATSVACTAPNAPWTVAGNVLTFPNTGLEPVEAGSVICPLVVLPATWMGGIGLSGPNAAQFAITGAVPNYVLTIGATALYAGSYSVTVTASP